MTNTDSCPSLGDWNNGNAIPGLSSMWLHSKGSPEIQVAVIDTAVDLGHPVFQHRRLKQVEKGISPGDHGTHISSIIGGYWESHYSGIAPGIQLLSFPVYQQNKDGSIQGCSPIELSRAIHQACDAGANIINISGGSRSVDPNANRHLKDAIKRCKKAERVVVAATGNDSSSKVQSPADQDWVLAVGAGNWDSQPAAFSNHSRSVEDGILAPGTQIPGAMVGGSIGYRSGTSFATPIVSGVIALILSIQKEFGGGVDPYEARSLVLETAEQGHSEESLNPKLIMRGRLNLQKIYQFLESKYLNNNYINKDSSMSENQETAVNKNSVNASDSEVPLTPPSNTQEISTSQEIGNQVPKIVGIPNVINPMISYPQIPANYQTMNPSFYPGMPIPNYAYLQRGENVSEPHPSESMGGLVRDSGKEISESSSITPSLVDTSRKVYCLGALGFDFLTDSRMDTFMQLLGKNKSIGSRIDISKFFLGCPVWDAQSGSKMRDPNEPGNLEWAEELTWTITQDNNPIYVLRPCGVNADEFYRILAQILYWGLDTEDQFIDPNIIVRHTVERIGVAGEVVGEQRLYNGTVVPVISCRLCGLNAWTVDDLVEGVISGLAKEKPVDNKDQVVEQIRYFLKKIYFEFKNLGVTDEDRAINYAGTNLFSAASCFADLFKDSEGVYELDQIDVVDSQIQRPNSILKDIKLTFFHPKKRIEKAKKCYRFTIDVADIYPVSVGGDPQTWSEY